MKRKIEKNLLYIYFLLHSAFICHDRAVLSQACYIKNRHVTIILLANPISRRIAYTILRNVLWKKSYNRNVKVERGVILQRQRSDLNSVDAKQASY